MNAGSSDVGSLMSATMSSPPRLTVAAAAVVARAAGAAVGALAGGAGTDGPQALAMDTPPAISSASSRKARRLVISAPSVLQAQCTGPCRAALSPSRAWLRRLRCGREAAPAMQRAARPNDQATGCVPL